MNPARLVQCCTVLLQMLLGSLVAHTEAVRCDSVRIGIQMPLQAPLDGSTAHTDTFRYGSVARSRCFGEVRLEHLLAGNLEHYTTDG